MYLSLNRTICNTIDKTRKYAHRVYINLLKSKTQNYDKLDEVSKCKALYYLMSYNMEIVDVDKVWVQSSKAPQYLLHIISYVDTYCR